MKYFISIYRSQKKEGMYLYVEKVQALSKVPRNLLDLFDEPKLVTHMMVDKEKEFAKMDGEKLIKEIQEKGFYLQMPDPLPEYKQHLIRSNEKLDAK